MTMPTRPEPAVGRFARWRSQLGRFRRNRPALLASRSSTSTMRRAGPDPLYEVAGGDTAGPDVLRYGGSPASLYDEVMPPAALARRQAAGFVAVAAVGAALLVVAGLWGWQRWSARSAPLIDDLLPTLSAVPTDGDGRDATADRAESEVGASGDTGQAESAAPAEPDAGSAPPATPLVGEGVSTPAGAPSVEVVEVVESEVVAPVLVHVSGAVETPGVVELAGDARVVDAVEAAGGAAADADLDRINLAAPIRDGARIHLPAVGEGDPPAVIGLDAAPWPEPTSTIPAAARTDRFVGDASAPVGPIDVNRATARELERLPGIGPTIAQAIVDLRTARGPYASIDELILVGGIGEAKLELVRPHAIVTSMP